MKQVVESAARAASHIAKDTPPVAVAGLTLFGYPLSEVVLTLTAIYTVVRIVLEIDEWFRKRRNDRRTAVLADRK